MSIEQTNQEPSVLGGRFYAHVIPSISCNQQVALITHTFKRVSVVMSLLLPCGIHHVLLPIERVTYFSEVEKSKKGVFRSFSYPSGLVLLRREMYPQNVHIYAGGRVVFLYVLIYIIHHLFFANMLRSDTSLYGSKQPLVIGNTPKSPFLDYENSEKKIFSSS